jgi:hypothetical protein
LILDKKEQTPNSIEGIISYLTKPLVGVFRYFFPPFECSITLNDNHNHFIHFKNTDKRNLYIKSIHPIKGLLKRKHSIIVNKKLLSGGKWKCELHYPYDELEWCIVCVKRFIPIPQIKEVRELKKMEFWIV